MSSYFDKMAQCLYDQNAIGELVFTQYRAYLRDLQEDVIEADEQKLSDLMTEMHKIHDRYKGNPVMLVETLHDLAHDVGRAGIRLKGGGRAGDNPNFVY